MEIGFEDIWLRDIVSTQLYNKLVPRMYTYDVCAGIALSSDVQRASFETWEDFDQVGKEVHLQSNSSAQSHFCCAADRR